MSTPQSPGVRRIPRAIGSHAATSSAPASWAISAIASRSSTAPRKFGYWTKTAAVSSSTAAASASRSVRPPAEPDAGDLGGIAGRVGGEGLPRLRVDAGGDDEPAPLRGADREVAGAGDGRRALVEAGARERQAGQLAHRGLELEHRLQAALGDLRLIRRVGRQELGAGDDRVDDRRRVVVVHAGAEEADLGLGVGVARGERPHPFVDLGLAEAVGQIEVAVEADPGGHVEELVDRGGPDRRPASRRARRR